ncbi:MAG: hypothetical protein F6K24_48145 [Okeania sp. SIO2D1]|nr:hypothetical protein [Okeania sp. SIO2D1]
MVFNSLENTFQDWLQELPPELPIIAVGKFNVTTDKPGFSQGTIVKTGERSRDKIFYSYVDLM